MGWDHMVSEASAERFVFRARTGPLCPVDSSKMKLCGNRKKTEKADWKVSVRVFELWSVRHMKCVPKTKN